MSKKRSNRAAGPATDFARILHEAGRPLRLTELFGLAGYDRDQPEQVEQFYLVLRSQIGRTVRQVGDAAENAELEAIDAPK